MPTELDFSSVDWLDGTYMETALLASKVWDARRSVLELYSWASYQLLRDSCTWRDREWDKCFVELVEHRLCFLAAPRRGCIIDPASISTDEVIALMRDSVSVHYQWRYRNGIPPINGWFTPTPAASRFDPYEFDRAYDYAAFKQAGGQYNNTMERAILGRPSAIELSESYHKHPRKRLFDLPTPEDPKPGGKKAKMLFFHARKCRG